MIWGTKKLRMPSSEEALPGRNTPLPRPPRHYVLDAPLPPETLPPGMARAMFGMGCFWGAERKFWQTPGVWSTAVGYAAGITPNPTYHEVCSGMTGHNEVVMVVYDPAEVSYEQLLRVFWESHDPTQGMRQGNDRGTQYRSGIYTFDADQATRAQASRLAFQDALSRRGFDPITTEIESAGPFYFAEVEHQQYLAKNPNGYCGLGGTGVPCPIGVSRAS